MELETGYRAPRITSEFKDCSMPVTFDQYKKCGYGCFYCFASYQRASNPSTKDYLDATKLKSVSIQSVKNLFLGKNPKHPYWKNHIEKKKVLQWGSMADPFCPFERENKVGLELLKFFAEIEYPIRFSSKSTLMVENGTPWQELLDKNKERLGKTWAFMFSIVTLDEQIAAIIEKGTPAPVKRFEAMAELKRMGYYTIHRLRPFLIGISDKTLDEMLDWEVKAKCNAISTEFFCLDLRVPFWIRKRYQKLSEIAGFDYMKFYAHNSPDSSGYYRLNPAIKAPYVFKMYEHCKRNGIQFAISDPHWKFLNDTGSCCGLPDDGSPLANWQRVQWTNWLVTAKRLNKKTWTWTEFIAEMHGEVDLLQNVAANDPKFQTGMKALRQKYANLLEDMHTCWNKSESLGSPYRYFHNAVKPIGLDANQDVIYEMLFIEGNSVAIQKQD